MIPGGLKIAGEDDAYDFGSGAGFYVDATQAPWDKGYRMASYITNELPKALFAHFAQLDASRVSITGHSMGGHGALTLVCPTRPYIYPFNPHSTSLKERKNRAGEDPQPYAYPRPSR